MNKLEFKELLREKVLILDGATGTQLQKLGFLKDVSTPEELNIKYPERIRQIYSSYISSGSDIILANTFGANKLKLKQYNLVDKMSDIIHAGVSIAKEEANKTNSFVAGDISSIGSYLYPLGAVSFDNAYEAFKEQAQILRDAKVDLIIIETMTEIKELKAAVLATRDVYDGPIIVQMTFTNDGSTVTGTDILSFIAMSESLQVDALGMNCSVGPKELLKLAQLMAKNTNLPISFKPNAGMPKLINRETIFPGTSEEFLDISLQAYESGINLFGGCCGTTPEYIKLLSDNLKNKKPIKREFIKHHLLSSRTKAVDLNLLQRPIKIGERINPTGRKKFQQELSKNIFGLVKSEARQQVQNGANILDVNMGLPGADETSLIVQAVNEIQEIVNVPLSLDSSFPEALNQACKHCAGKPLINSVNGETEKLDLILPIAKRYGASLIALTVDEQGIPNTWQKRIEIAGKILEFADKYGVNRSEIIFDYLTLSASSSPEQAEETLYAVKQSKLKFPECKTLLGISNISFGLPSRQTINSTFLKMALDVGLDFAICNPSLDWDIDDSYARDLLTNKDPNAKKYVAQFSNVAKAVTTQETSLSPKDKLFNSIINGDKEYMIELIDEILKEDNNPLFISNELILKALNIVGEKFNSKEFFLPQVIMAAEASQIAFAHIKPMLKKEKNVVYGKVVMATVKGDVHDIGKNIVCAVLESFGFEVFDIGKNIDKETIIQKAKEYDADIIGLSALMTTTMVEMEKVIELKNSLNMDIKIMVGGAPVTKEFAENIGAEGYSRDAIEAARVATSLIK
ncbi:MAG: homocysteine S-methyltransferase family protein [Endomicrobiia bacterium]